MYNYGSAAEVLDTVFEVIEGGKTVEAAKTAAVVADNGTKLFDVAASEVYAANGSAATVESVVSIGEGAASGTTAGAGLLAMDVGAVGAAIAPALGIVAGAGLYNLTPDFWDGIANTLMDAGSTVKGKVMGMVTPDGMTLLPKSTIEAFKNAFINGGVYTPPAGHSGLTYQVSNLANYSAVLGITPDFVASELMNNSRVTEHFTDTYIANNVNTAWEEIQNGAGLSAAINACVNDPIVIVYPMWDWSGIGGFEHYVGVYMQIIDAVLPVDITIDINELGDVGTITFSHAVNIYKIYQWRNGSYSGQLHVETYDVNAWQNITTQRFTPSNDWNVLQNYLCNFINNPNLQPNAVYPELNINFNITYPEWLPYEFPDTLPVEIPDWYPLSLPTPDITQDPSQAGANDTDIQLNKLIELIFQALPENDPLIEPDPDPSPEIEPEPSPTPPDPDPNPPDPNPPIPDPIPTIPIPTLDTTRADRMFTVYNPTDANVNSLGAFLWTNNVIEQIKKLWDDPMQAIISFHKIYGAPTVGNSTEIVLGYIESGVSAPVVTSQFCEVDCGSVTVPELLNNATSYAPFTSLHIYLPFIGIMELDTNECMKATLHVKYRIDVYTGTCIALIYVSRNPDLTHEQVLYTFSGNASQQLPLTSSSFGGAISALLGLAGAGVAVASGGALGVAAGAVSAAHSLTQEMVHINRSGGLSANAGILGSRTPYLILSRQYCSDANGYAGFYGYPSNKTVYIGNCNGYIKCKDVIFRGSCTQAEAEEIESLLKSGVYV